MQTTQGWSLRTRNACEPCRKEEVKPSSRVCWRGGGQGTELKGKRGKKIKLTVAGEEGQRERKAFSPRTKGNRAGLSPQQCLQWEWHRKINLTGPRSEVQMPQRSLITVGQQNVPWAQMKTSPVLAFTPTVWLPLPGPQFLHLSSEKVE